MGYQVYGVELNQKLCLYSRELLADDSAILEADLLAAKFPSETFDVLYMRDLIQHIPNPIEFLKECNRVAKPGCTIYIGTHNIDGLIPRIVKSRYTPVFGFMEPCHYSPKSITEALVRAGFEIRDIQFVSLDCTLREVINHFLSPTFTTVFPEESTGFWRFVLRGLRTLISIPPINRMDQLIIPRISTWLKIGTWMNVLATKTA